MFLQQRGRVHFLACKESLENVQVFKVVGVYCEFSVVQHVLLFSSSPNATLARVMLWYSTRCT